LIGSIEENIVIPAQAGMTKAFGVASQRAAICELIVLRKRFPTWPVYDLIAGMSDTDSHQANVALNVSTQRVKATKDTISTR
jgi:hypothetical protein